MCNIILCCDDLFCAMRVRMNFEKSTNQTTD